MCPLWMPLNKNITARSRCLNWHLPCFNSRCQRVSVRARLYCLKSGIVRDTRKSRSLSVACRTHSGMSKRGRDTEWMPAAIWKKYEFLLLQRICAICLFRNFPYLPSSKQDFYDMLFSASSCLIHFLIRTAYAAPLPVPVAFHLFYPLALFPDLRTDVEFLSRKISFTSAFPAHQTVPA